MSEKFHNNEQTQFYVCPLLFLISESTEIVVIMHNDPIHCIGVNITSKNIIERNAADNGSTQPSMLAS